LPENYVRKNNKMPQFYMITARIIFFFPIFFVGGGHTAHAHPLSPMPIWFANVSGNISTPILSHTLNLARQNSPKYAISLSQRKFMGRGIPSPHPTSLGTSYPSFELALTPLPSSESHHHLTPSKFKRHLKTHRFTSP